MARDAHLLGDGGLEQFRDELQHAIVWARARLEMANLTGIERGNVEAALAGWREDLADLERESWRRAEARYGEPVTRH